MENELFQSCQTRTVTVKKPIKVKTVKVDGKKRLEEERIEYAEEEVVVPANVTAQIFYLKNRRPEKWKDKPMESAVKDMYWLNDRSKGEFPKTQKVTLDGVVQLSPFDNLTDEELRRLAQMDEDLDVEPE